MAPTSSYTPTTRLLRKREAARIRQRRCRQRKREAVHLKQPHRPEESASPTPPKLSSPHPRSTSNTIYASPKYQHHLTTIAEVSPHESINMKVVDMSSENQQMTHHHLYSEKHHHPYRPSSSSQAPMRGYSTAAAPVPPLPPTYQSSTSAPHHPHYQHPHHPQQPSELPTRSYYRRPSSSAWEPYNPPPMHSNHHMRGGPSSHGHQYPQHSGTTSSSYHAPHPSQPPLHPSHHPSHASYGPPPSHAHGMIHNSGSTSGHHHGHYAQYMPPQHQQQHPSYPCNGYATSAPAYHPHHPLPPVYPAVESTRAISRSPSASSLETPATKRSDSSHEESERQLYSYPNDFKITETAVKRKSNKSLLSTEKAAVFAMLTLKNNSSDDSDESTVASHGTFNRRPNDEAIHPPAADDDAGFGCDEEDNGQAMNACAHNVQPIVFNLQNVSNAMAV